MKNYIGIDLHSNNSVVLASDGEDRVIFQRRIPNDLDRIDVQLVLAGRWIDGCRILGASGESVSNQKVRGAEI